MPVLKCFSIVQNGNDYAKPKKTFSVTLKSGGRNDDLHQSGAVIEMDKKKKFCVFFNNKKSR